MGSKQAFLSTEPSPANPGVSERPRAAGEGEAGKTSRPSRKARPPLAPSTSSGQRTLPGTVFTLGEAARRQRFSSNRGTPCPWTILFCKKQEEGGEPGQLWRRRDKRSPTRSRQSRVTGPPHAGHGEGSCFCCFRWSRVAAGRGRSPAARRRGGEQGRSLLLSATMTFKRHALAHLSIG